MAVEPDRIECRESLFDRGAAVPHFNHQDAARPEMPGRLGDQALDRLGLTERVRRADFPVKWGAQLLTHDGRLGDSLEELRASGVLDKVVDVSGSQVVAGHFPPIYHYLLRHDRYWPGVLDEVESRIVEERLRKEGIEIHHGTEVSEIVGQGGRVRGVITAGGERIACDLVAVAVGVRPRLELAAGLAVDRGILVDEYLQASLPGILAAGDVAQVFDPTSGRAALDTLWSIAVGQGRAAGRNMAGRQAAYRKPVPFNVTRLAGLTTTIIGAVGRGRDASLAGIVRGESETWRHHPGVPSAQDNFEVNRVRVLVGQQALLGAVVMGDQALSRPLQELVADRVDISPIRDDLLRPGARPAEIILRFWSEGTRSEETSRSRSPAAASTSLWPGRT